MGNFNKTQKNDVVKSGYITMQLVKERYKGEDKFQLVGRIKAGSGFYIVSISCDNTGKAFIYEGKGEAEGVTFARMNVTALRYKSAKRTYTKKSGNYSNARKGISANKNFNRG